MPDDNRFATIGVDDANAEADDDHDEERAPERDDGTTDDDANAPGSTADGDAATSEGDDTQSASETDETAAATGAADGADGADTESAPTVDPADSGPAFEFDAVQQKAVYPRPESWDAREAALDFEVKRKLRDHGVKDVTGRELDDAIARTIPDVTDLIVEKILDARRRKFEDD